MHSGSERKIRMLKTSEIQPPAQPTRKNFDLYELQRLADSIATVGVLQPLSVRRQSDGHYELIAGERRLRAAESAGLRRVPCFVLKTDELTAACFSLAENIQRTPLTVFEEAEAIQQLMNRFHLSQNEVAIRLGLPATVLSEKLRFLRLSPELQARLTDAGLTERHAKLLLRLPNEKQTAVLDKIIAEGLTLRQSDALVAQELQSESEEVTKQLPPLPTRKMAIGDLRLFDNSLTKLVDTMVSAGIPTQSRKTDADGYLEYCIRIRKPTPPATEAAPEYQQLKIC